MAKAARPWYQALAERKVGRVYIQHTMAQLARPPSTEHTWRGSSSTTVAVERRVRSRARPTAKGDQGRDEVLVLRIWAAETEGVAG